MSFPSHTGLTATSLPAAVCAYTSCVNLQVHVFGKYFSACLTGDSN